MRFIRRATLQLIAIILSLSTLFISDLNAASYKKNAESGKEPWGADAELCSIKNDKQIAAPTYSLTSHACQQAIRFFQNYISIVDGPRSSYIPSSSQYALVAIQRFGIFKGIALGCDRLMRENEEPWVYRTTDKYGIDRKWDPVPKKLP